MIRKHNLIAVGALLIGIFAVALCFFQVRQVFGDIANQTAGNTNNTGKFVNYNFFATSSPQLAGYGTSTQDTGGAGNQATSTNIAGWFNSTTGQYDNGTFNVAGAQQVTLICGRGATSTNSGSNTCTYQVEMGPNGPWLYLNQLSPIASTTLQIAGSVNGSANLNQLVVPSGTSTIAAITLGEGFYAVRCIVNITTDGVGFCSASALW